MLSVVIPCYNESETIINLLICLEKQSLSSDLFEIIIVNNSSTDDTQFKVRNFIKTSKNNIILVDEYNKGVSFAKNSGALASHFNYLVFLDADNTVTFQFLEYILIDIMSGGVCGTIRTLSNESSKYLGNLVLQFLEIIKMISPRPFGKSYIRKDIFFEVGGYNTKIQLGENVEFLNQAKAHIKKFKIGKFGHITHPIGTSLRRFTLEGYIKTLFNWLIAYLGYWKLDYLTISELEDKL